MTLNDQTMYQTASDLKARAQRAVMPGVVAILAALIFTVIFNFLINIYVVSPIIRITKGIQGFLRTKEPLDIEVATEDELFHLLSSIRELLSKFEADAAAK